MKKKKDDMHIKIIILQQQQKNYWFLRLPITSLLSLAKCAREHVLTQQYIFSRFYQNFDVIRSLKILDTDTKPQTTNHNKMPSLVLKKQRTTKQKETERKKIKQ